MSNGTFLSTFVKRPTPLRGLLVPLFHPNT
jgi:hypothetical protein